MLQVRPSNIPPPNMFAILLLCVTHQSHPKATHVSYATLRDQIGLSSGFWPSAADAEIPLGHLQSGSAEGTKAAHELQQSVLVLSEPGGGGDGCRETQAEVTWSRCLSGAQLGGKAFWGGGKHGKYKDRETGKLASCSGSRSKRGASSACGRVRGSSARWKKWVKERASVS